MKNVLILSTTDSARSQMVRGYLQYFARKRANIYSAGLKAGKLNPMAVEVMAEDGIDISNHTTNALTDYENMAFDFIVTVCDSAKENCPYYPSKALRIHQNLQELSKLKGSEEEKLEIFREVRDDARLFAHKFSKVHFKGLR
jgi:arsenate reductase